jgi:hypothetical protein
MYETSYPPLLVLFVELTKALESVSLEGSPNMLHGFGLHIYPIYLHYFSMDKAGQALNVYP